MPYPSPPLRPNPFGSPFENGAARRLCPARRSIAASPSPDDTTLRDADGAPQRNAGTSGTGADPDCPVRSTRPESRRTPRCRSSTRREQGRDLYHPRLPRLLQRSTRSTADRKSSGRTPKLLLFCRRSGGGSCDRVAAPATGPRGSLLLSMLRGNDPTAESPAARDPSRTKASHEAARVATCPETNAGPTRSRCPLAHRQEDNASRQGTRLRRRPRSRRGRATAFRRIRARGSRSRRGGARSIAFAAIARWRIVPSVLRSSYASTSRSTRP